MKNLLLTTFPLTTSMWLEMVSTVINSAQYVRSQWELRNNISYVHAINYSSDIPRKLFIKVLLINHIMV